MRLNILLPYKIFMIKEVTKVNAEAKNGAFGILPRHVDFVTMLTPGILSFSDKSGEMHFLAVDEGVLVKQGPEIYISTQNAVQEDDLEKLFQTVQEEFLNLNDREKKARSAAAMMEADFIRKFIEKEQM